CLCFGSLRFEVDFGRVLLFDTAISCVIGSCLKWLIFLSHKRGTFPHAACVVSEWRRRDSGGSRSRGFAQSNTRGEQRLMTRTPIRLVSGAFFAASLFFPAIIQAQGPAGSGGREIQTEVQKADPRIDQVIERANDHFRKGKLNLEDNKRYEARDEFDKAVDEVLTSGLDVRANQRLQTFYLELVERIYREEVPMIQTAPQQVNATPVVAQSAPNANAEKVEVAQAQEPKTV